MMENQRGLKRGTWILNGALAVQVAFVSPAGNVVINWFGLHGRPSALVWIFVAAVGMMVGGVLSVLDRMSKGRY